jgi:hypothetical protein
LRQLNIILFTILTVIAGCSSNGNDTRDINLEWIISPYPPAIGTVQFQVILSDTLARPITGAMMDIEANMSHPGMSPMMAELEEEEAGVYSAEIEFSMGGDWFILVNARLPDERVINRQINIPGVKSNP